MSIPRSFRVACVGLGFPLLLAGCSGGDAPASPTARPAATGSPAASGSATPTPIASPSPSADLTPDDGISPLGGKPASEAEKEYYTKKKEAEDLALAKNYEKAIPMFEELLKENSGDIEVMFYLMLSYGSTEPAPSKKGKAYEYAQKILAADPDSREAPKARSYVNSANLSIPDKFKYGDDSMEARGGWVLTEEALYKTTADIPLHSDMTARIGTAEQSTLWETEASPATATGAEKLPKGTEVHVLSTKDFLYGLTSWRKPLKQKDPQLDDTIFDVSAMFVEVTSEGPLKGKRGWIVNQVDRYRGVDGAPWGVWISNRLQVAREADIAEAEAAAKAAGR